jgi:uncharacterized glyoxalase superfamily protein PhnB
MTSMTCTEITSNAGAIIRQPPTNFPWGVREMNVEDPDGHRLRIGSDATGPTDRASLSDSI